MANAEAENRTHKRYSIMGCTIRYKPDTFFSRFSKVSHKYMVLDISQSGMQFITKEKFNKQTPLLLDITAPTLNREIIHIKGRVVWIKASPALHIYGVGVEFINMKEADRLRLQLLLDNAAASKSKISDNVHLDKADKR
ncbi:MAG: PilZ domain-containing protein [Planctomycetota bacterium]